MAEGIDFTSTEEISRHPKVVEAFAGVVETTNAGLASYEQIKKHAVLPLMLSIDDSTLTPTLKITRRVVQKQCTDLIEGVCEDDRKAQGSGCRVQGAGYRVQGRRDP